MLRLLKLARYTPALPLFAAVIRNESRALLATLLVVVVLLVLEASIMYVLEREAQPKIFASIPHAMWWAIVTIATVGYGDMFPITPVGKVFGGVVMVIGIAVFAVPAGILATGFASEIRKRDFVVTWQTVANVPLFAGLDAARIAEIARLLKRQVVPAQFAVVRRGDPGGRDVLHHGRRGPGRHLPDARPARPRPVLRRDRPHSRHGAHGDGDHARPSASSCPSTSPTSGASSRTTPVSRRRSPGPPRSASAR